MWAVRAGYVAVGLYVLPTTVQKMTGSDGSRGSDGVTATDALEALSASFVDVGCLVDRDGEIVDVLCPPNSDSPVTIGDSFAGATIQAAFRPELASRLTETVERVLSANDGETVTVGLTVDGRRRWYELCVAPVGENGQQALAMVRDVTTYTRDRVRLEHQQQTVWEMLNALDDMVYVTDADGTLAEWNTAVETTTGYGPETLTEMRPGDVVPADSIEQLERFRERLRENRTARGEIDIVTRDGERIPHEFVTSWVEGADGEQRLVGIGRSIAEQRRQQAELEQQRQVTQDMLAAIDDIFYVVGSDGALREWNESVRDVTGYTDEELAGTSPTMFFHEDEHERVLTEVAEAFRTGHRRFESELLTKDGEQIPYQFVANTFEMPDGETVICGIGRDVSERVEREEQIGVFGRVLRHNIRNVMTVVFGELDYLRANVDPELNEHVDRIDRVSESLLGLSEKGYTITDVLLGQQLQQRVRLDELVARAIADVEDRYPDAEFAVSVPSGTAVLGVPGLASGIQELLHNACQHNTAPTVTVVADSRDDGIWLTVADDGCGLPPNEANIITRTAPITPLFHGVGMGLWLVRWVVKRSGGTIDYRESPDGGTQFDIRLQPACARDEANS